MIVNINLLIQFLFEKKVSKLKILRNYQKTPKKMNV